MVRLENLKRRKGLQEPGNIFLLEFVRGLQRCYEADRPLKQRINDLGEGLLTLDKLDQPEHELIALLAASRWLLRAKAKDLARDCLGEYRLRSLCLSQGESFDLLNQLSEFFID